MRKIFFLVGLMIIVSSLSIGTAEANDNTTNITIDVYIDNGTVKLTYGSNSETYNSLVNDTSHNFVLPANLTYMGSGCLDDFKWYLDEFEGGFYAWVQNTLWPSVNDLNECEANLSICNSKIEGRQGELDAKDDRIDALKDSVDAKDTEIGLLLMATVALGIIVVLTIIGSSGLLNKLVKRKGLELPRGRVPEYSERK